MALVTISVATKPIWSLALIEIFADWLSKVALVGLVRLKVKSSIFSGNLSFEIGIIIVAVVSPGSKVNTPLTDV